MEGWPACKNYTVWLFDTLTDEKRAANNSKSWEMKGLENLSYCSHCSHRKGQGVGGAASGRTVGSLYPKAICCPPQLGLAGAALPGATPDRRPVPAAGTLALPAQSLCGNYLS